MDSLVTQEEKTLYQAIRGDFTAYKKPGYAAIDLASSDLNDATMFLATADEKFQKLNGSLRDLLDLEEKLSQERHDVSLGSFNSALKIFILVLGVAIVLSVLISLLTARLITSPASKTMRVIQRIAEGDLTQEIELTSQDEIGQLAQSVNTMRMKMGETVGQSVAMPQGLSEAASVQAAKNTSGLIEDMVKKIRNREKLVGVTNEAFKEIMGSSGKVVQLIVEIAGSSQEQSLGIDQISRAVSEMNNLTQENAAGAEELASIMAMFRTNHDSSAEVFHDRKKTIDSIERGQKARVARPSMKI